MSVAGSVITHVTEKLCRKWEVFIVYCWIICYMGMLRKPWMSESMGDKTSVSGTDSIEDSDNV